MIAAFTDHFPAFIVDIMTIAGPWLGVLAVVDFSLDRVLDLMGF